MTGRIWHSGPPRHFGWWEVSRFGRAEGSWRWWSGVEWSLPVSWQSIAPVPAYGIDVNREQLMWSDYWPENARVPRLAVLLHEAHMSAEDGDLVLAAAQAMGDPVAQWHRSDPRVAILRSGAVFQPLYENRICDADGCAARLAANMEIDVWRSGGTVSAFRSSERVEINRPCGFDPAEAIRRVIVEVAAAVLPLTTLKRRP